MKSRASAHRRIAIFIFALLIAMTAVACSVDMEFDDPKVVSISIYSMLNVDGYVAGDALDLTDAEILVVYDDRTTKILPLTDDMIDYSSLDMTEPENKKRITVRFGGAETSFEISVAAWNFQKAELTKLPNKLIYIEGESVDPAGAELSIYYDGGNIVKEPVKKDMLESYSNSVGERAVKINYFGAANLAFNVTFMKKTAVKLNILREPAQVSVFLGYGQNLSRDNMKIKITYDNNVEKIFENPTASGGASEAVAQSRSEWADNIENNLVVYIDDSIINSAVNAKVSYIEPSIDDTIVYNFTGTARVKTGDVVDGSTIIATTSYLEDIRSKSEGIVTDVTANSVTVSRHITYKCNMPSYKVGDIVSKYQSVGRQAGAEVESAVSGMVTAVGGGEITIRALPTSQFIIAVSDRSFESMEIISYPTTSKYGNSRYNIIQGDTLDLSTGRVRVTFDNGEKEEYSMNHGNIIKVLNSAANFRREIPGLIFRSTENVSGVVGGQTYSLLYEIAYAEGYTYPTDSISTIVSVVDESGNINVSGNRLIVPTAGKNYTVSIVVTYTPPEGEPLRSEASYMVSTVGAPTKAEQLDITAAGLHTLRVVYGGIAANYVEMEVNVIQKVPVGILTYGALGTTAANGTFNNWLYIGDSLSFNGIEYEVIYSNGDVDGRKGVTKNMVVSASNGISPDLVCEGVGEARYVDVSVPGYSDIKQRLNFKVIPLPITSVTVKEEPIDAFLTGKGVTGGGITGSTSIDITGAKFTVGYYGGGIVTLSDTAMLNLYINNGKGDDENALTYPYIRFTYKASDTEPLSIAQIYEQEMSYTATMTYADSYGTKYSTEIKYYIVAAKPKTIKVTARTYEGEGQYKADYVQCEEWDFTGVNLIVTYDGESGSTITDTIALRTYMVYKTDTNSVGNGIPLRVRFLGKLEETPTLTFNVTEREETGIVLTKKGKETYTVTGSGLDLSEYNFAITFNAGTSQAVIGITAFTGGPKARGWWFEVFAAEIADGQTQPAPRLDDGGSLIVSSMREIGHKMIRLWHTSESEIRGSDGQRRYNLRYIDFFVKVDYTPVIIQRIAFEDTAEFRGNGTPILGTFAVSMPLIYNTYNPATNTLKEKVLTIYYSDGSKGTLELSNKSVGLDYKSEDTSTGYRTVTITYDGSTCYADVLIYDAELVSISLTSLPTTNFISGAPVTVDGGILQAVYRIKSSGETFSNYVLMNSETKLLRYDNINSTIAEYDDHNVYIEYKTMEISITYGTEMNNTDTKYYVTIYNKQDVDFTYGNVIFFYGNTKGAIATSRQPLAEFDLPDESAITLNYVSSEHFLSYTPEEYALHKLANPKLTEIVLHDENGKEFILYVDMDNVIKPTDTPERPYTPAKTGYTYYIMMMVNGNKYYRTRNYCLQKYLIIPKVVEVSVVSANELAFVMRVSTNNNPAAVSWLYANISSISSNYTSPAIGGAANPNYVDYIQKIELASPNAAYFEILITLTDGYYSDQTANYNEIIVILNSIHAQINARAAINSSSIAKGVNIGEYNGGQPDYITYIVAAGETLTLSGVLEVLNGKLEITVADGRYGIGEYRVNNNSATLYHNNYNIDLVSGRDTVFRVTANRVEGISVEGLDGGAVSIVSGQSLSAQVTPLAGGARMAHWYEFVFYTSYSRTPDTRVEFDGWPVILDSGNTQETYYADLNTDFYRKADNTGPYGLQFTVIVTAQE